jgi:hypothetical protein
MVGLLIVVAAGAAQRPGKQPPLLEPGRPVQTQVRVSGDDGKSFRVRVPEDAVMLEVRISGAAADLDVFLRHGEPMDVPEEDADHSNASRGQALQTSNGGG